ncbi:MAG: S-methyl-5-thioribose-1-phosphate isomerase [Rhodospirillaceae bacterium]|nr:S-methyl-5-thioribose-1-phosphate isomerase [Rhodospirillaceae bacterium]
MKIDGRPFRTIWADPADRAVHVIDQTALPHAFVVKRLAGLEDAADAIQAMTVRGAPLIGVTAAYGLALALAADSSDDGMERAIQRLSATRPTAVNLRWALAEMRAGLTPLPPAARAEAAWARAQALADADAAANETLGNHGLTLLAALWETRRAEGAACLNILTHCNAGWLATVDWGTALAPVYKAFEDGIPLHVWVDETRPRNQGASLTARELSWQGIAHTVIADNAGGHLMQRGQVDLCLVGADRVTARGDVCNKIGTYLKALAAWDSGIPFYAALPSSTIDWDIEDGRAIPIEERSPSEVSHIAGAGPDGQIIAVRLTPEGSPCANPGFDVTPARLITALITEQGIHPASTEGLAPLHPERNPS